MSWNFKAMQNQIIAQACATNKLNPKITQQCQTICHRESRTFAKQLEGYHGVVKVLVVVQPSAKNFELEPKVRFVIRGLDCMEALVWKNSRREDI